MTELAYDLHIHSCLSPCGDDDMTPANIAGMAALKGLDAVALTDHNSCKNCPAFLAAAKEYGIIGIPGMELTTSEEVHAVCLFPELYQAMEFDRFVYSRLIKVKNRPEILENSRFMMKMILSTGKNPVCLSMPLICLLRGCGKRRLPTGVSCFRPILIKFQQPHCQSGLYSSGQLLSDCGTEGYEEASFSETGTPLSGALPHHQ